MKTILVRLALNLDLEYFHPTQLNEDTSKYDHSLNMLPGKDGSDWRTANNDAVWQTWAKEKPLPRLDLHGKLLQFGSKRFDWSLDGGLGGDFAGSSLSNFKETNSKDKASKFQESLAENFKNFPCQNLEYAPWNELDPVPTLAKTSVAGWNPSSGGGGAGDVYTLTVEVHIRAKSKNTAAENLADTVEGDLSTHGAKLCHAVVGGIDAAAVAKFSPMAGNLMYTWQTGCYVESGDVSWTDAATSGDYGLLQFKAKIKVPSSDSSHVDSLFSTGLTDLKQKVLDKFGTQYSSPNMPEWLFDVWCHMWNTPRERVHTVFFAENNKPWEHTGLYDD